MKLIEQNDDLSGNKKLKILQYENLEAKENTGRYEEHKNQQGRPNVKRKKRNREKKIW